MWVDVTGGLVLKKCGLHRKMQCLVLFFQKFRDSRHINMHILNSNKQLHSKYVLVPADKASNNVIVVYYLEVVLREIKTTTTYECVTEEYDDLVDKHSEYMAANRMVVQPERFIGFQSYTKALMVQGL